MLLIFRMLMSSKQKDCPTFMGLELRQHASAISVGHRIVSNACVNRVITERRFANSPINAKVIDVANDINLTHLRLCTIAPACITVL